jgi:hypothetical protein
MEWPRDRRSVDGMDTQTLTRTGGDVRRQLHPSREQLRVAAAMFGAATEDVTAIVVPVVVPAAAGPVVAEQLDAQPVEYPGGYWLADRAGREGAYSFSAARDAAQAAAQAYLGRAGRNGLAGWISIRPNGTWAALDGLVPAPR